MNEGSYGFIPATREALINDDLGELAVTGGSWKSFPNGTLRIGSGDGADAALPPGVVIDNGADLMPDYLWNGDQPANGMAMSFTNGALANDEDGLIPAAAAKTAARMLAEQRARREIIRQLRIAAARDAALQAEHRERTLLIEGNRAARRRAAKVNRKAAVQEAKRVLAFAKRTGRK